MVILLLAIIVLILMFGANPVLGAIGLAVTVVFWIGMAAIGAATFDRWSAPALIIGGGFLVVFILLKLRDRSTKQWSLELAEMAKRTDNTATTPAPSLSATSKPELDFKQRAQLVKEDMALRREQEELERTRKDPDQLAAVVRQRKALRAILSG